MNHTRTLQRSRSEQLLQTLSEYDQFLIVTHDNPDPDAIATGWAVQALIEERLGKPVRLIGGGAIVRAENRHMVDLLSPPIELVNDVDVTEGTATVLVDCHLGASNHLLTRKGIKPVAVIDHHGTADAAPRIAFCDIRPEAAASASIVAGYMREQGIDPGAKLATALVYAMRTETRGCETHHSRLDRSVLPWLTEHADPTLLAEIENAPLTRTYFGDLLLAMQNTFTYDDAALCFLPRASGPEIVGEVADLLIRCEGVTRVLCCAVLGDDLLLSSRTSMEADNATRLLQATLNGLGGCGGHDHRAGGKIAGVAGSPKLVDELHEELRERWLAACQINRHRGTRLVPLRDIVQNL